MSTLLCSVPHFAVSFSGMFVLLFLCSTLLANQGLFVLSVDKGTNPALLAKLLSLEHVGCTREEE